MTNKVISVEHLTKRYELGVIGTGTLTRDLERWWARTRGRPDPYTRIGQRDAFERAGESILALDDVSFTVEQGEALGIIGKNGAGKSTLLKILSRVTAPTSGVVKVKGRIGSLLEVGTGFHPELTGRENIYLNGAILGMRKDEVTRKFDEIVDFSGVEQFIDTPVKRYSSGMYVRLAFAVAAHLESEILIVDEVLAVGDAEFQKKCLGKMGDVASREGRTVLFVSHNLAAVQKLCLHGIMLQNGFIRFQGDIDACVLSYISTQTTNPLHWERKTEINKSLQICEVMINLVGKQPHIVLHGKIKLTSHNQHKMAFISLDIISSIGTAIMQVLPRLEPFIDSQNRVHICEMDINLPPLIPGKYSVSVWVGSHNTETLDQVEDSVSFDIEEPPTKGRTFPYHSNHGFIVPTSEITYNGNSLSN